MLAVGTAESLGAGAEAGDVGTVDEATEGLGAVESQADRPRERPMTAIEMIDLVDRRSNRLCISATPARLGPAPPAPVVHVHGTPG